MARLVEEHASEWNRRFVVEVDGGARVEAVLYRGDSLCVSTQVGCAVGCPFCASGANGLTRPLSLDELIGQVEAVRSQASFDRVTLSGVGEPLHCPGTLAFIAWCRRERLAPSVTTSGGPIEKLRDLLRAPHNGITVSVHAGTEATRARAVPRGPSLEALFAALTEELPRMSRSRRKKVAVAYLVIRDLNDASDELDAFAARAEPLGLRTHLYAYNPVPTSAHQPVGRASYEAAYERLRARGLNVRMSSQARVEANGGCGTLVAVRPRRDAAILA
ncbi:MAG: radical SAM protein [Sandaracinaceae bacterium]